MLTWLLLIPVAALFVAINIIVGCYAAIRLGYGPPDWRTALNLVVRITTLQDRLNASRDWLDKKAPWADKLLDRLRVPKPIIIVDPSEEEKATDDIDEMIDEVVDKVDEAADETEEVVDETDKVAGEVDEAVGETSIIQAIIQNVPL
jgi:hypothetical protein